jgi:hypothetical protein
LVQESNREPEQEPLSISIITGTATYKNSRLKASITVQNMLEYDTMRWQNQQSIQTHQGDTRLIITGKSR